MAMLHIPSTVRNMHIHNPANWTEHQLAHKHSDFRMSPVYVHTCTNTNTVTTEFRGDWLHVQTVYIYQALFLLPILHTWERGYIFKPYFKFIFRSIARVASGTENYKQPCTTSTYFTYMCSFVDAYHFPFCHMYLASLSLHTCMQHASSLLTLFPHTLSYPHLYPITPSHQTHTEPYPTGL